MVYILNKILSTASHSTVQKCTVSFPVINKCILKMKRDTSSELTHTIINIRQAIIYYSIFNLIIYRKIILIHFVSSYCNFIDEFRCQRPERVTTEVPWPLHCKHEKPSFYFFRIKKLILIKNMCINWQNYMLSAGRR